MNNWEMGRRDLLKRLGVGLGCLPILHGSRAWALPATQPRRLMIVMITNGYRQAFWRPTSNGPLATQTLPDSTSPLEPHKSDLIFLPGMTDPAYSGGLHGAYVNCLAAGPNDGLKEYRIPFTPTIDQVVGDTVAKQATLARSTLNLGVLVDQGKAGIFPSKRCFWRDRNDPITPEADLYQTYGNLFASPTAATTPAADASVKKMMAHKKSILDYVGANLQSFATRLGTDDRASIDGHLQSIRDLEQQMQVAKMDLSQCGTSPGTPVDFLDVANYPTLIQVSMSLMVAALRCDVTRVTGLATTDANGGIIPFSFVPGIPVKGTGFDSPLRNWHDIAHNPVLNGMDHKRLVDKWWMTQLASLIQQLKSVPEPNGTLLDNTVVLFANHMEEGTNHNSQKTPWILAGSCGGYFKTGQCLASDGQPLNGVLVEIANAMGAPVEFFGDPKYGGAMPGLH